MPHGECLHQQARRDLVRPDVIGKSCRGDKLSPPCGASPRRPATDHRYAQFRPAAQRQRRTVQWCSWNSAVLAPRWRVDRAESSSVRGDVRLHWPLGWSSRSRNVQNLQCWLSFSWAPRSRRRLRLDVQRAIAAGRGMQTLSRTDRLLWGRGLARRWLSSAKEAMPVGLHSAGPFASRTEGQPSISLNPNYLAVTVPQLARKQLFSCVPSPVSGHMTRAAKSS